jgi:hypothetical protein
MHNAAHRPIKLRRVMFAVVPTPLDGPTQHTRSALQSANPLSMERVVPAKNSSSCATISPIGSDEPSSDVRSTMALQPASPVIARRSERLLQPPERYSPGLFFTNSGEPMTYREAMEATPVAS